MIDLAKLEQIAREGFKDCPEMFLDENKARLDKAAQAMSVSGEAVTAEQIKKTYKKIEKGCGRTEEGAQLLSAWLQYKYAEDIGAIIANEANRRDFLDAIAKMQIGMALQGQGSEESSKSLQVLNALVAEVKRGMEASDSQAVSAKIEASDERAHEKANEVKSCVRAAEQALKDGNPTNITDDTKKYFRYLNDQFDKYTVLRSLVEQGAKAQWLPTSLGVNAKAYKEILRYFKKAADLELKTQKHDKAVWEASSTFEQAQSELMDVIKVQAIAGDTVLWGAVAKANFGENCEIKEMSGLTQSDMYELLVKAKDSGVDIPKDIVDKISECEQPYAAWCQAEANKRQSEGEHARAVNQLHARLDEHFSSIMRFQSAKKYFEPLSDDLHQMWHQACEAKHGAVEAARVKCIQKTNGFEAVKKGMGANASKLKEDALRNAERKMSDAEKVYGDVSREDMVCGEECSQMQSDRRMMFDVLVEAGNGRLSRRIDQDTNKKLAALNVAVDVYRGRSMILAKEMLDLDRKMQRLRGKVSGGKQDGKTLSSIGKLEKKQLDMQAMKKRLDGYSSSCLALVDLMRQHDKDALDRSEAINKGYCELQCSVDKVELDALVSGPESKQVIKTKHAHVQKKLSSAFKLEVIASPMKKMSPSSIAGEQECDLQPEKDQVDAVVGVPVGAPGMIVENLISDARVMQGVNAGDEDASRKIVAEWERLVVPTLGEVAEGSIEEMAVRSIANIKDRLAGDEEGMFSADDVIPLQICLTKMKYKQAMDALQGDDSHAMQDYVDCMVKVKLITQDPGALSCMLNGVSAGIAYNLKAVLRREIHDPMVSEAEEKAGKILRVVGVSERLKKREVPAEYLVYAKHLHEAKYKIHCYKQIVRQECEGLQRQGIILGKEIIDLIEQQQEEYDRLKVQYEEAAARERGAHREVAELKQSVTQVSEAPLQKAQQVVKKAEEVTAAARCELHACANRCLGNTPRLMLLNKLNKLNKLNRRILGDGALDLTAKTMSDSVQLVNYILERNSKGEHTSSKFWARMTKGYSKDEKLSAAFKFLQVKQGATNVTFSKREFGALKQGSIGGLLDAIKSVEPSIRGVASLKKYIVGRGAKLMKSDSVKRHSHSADKASGLKK